MHYIKFIRLIVLFGMLISCQVEPKPIEYGTDQCSACKMRISDSRFGAELVTKKGKVYKYDAIECMVEDVLKNGPDNYAHILVTDFLDPGKLVDGTNVNYLISENRPSPMGAFLSAYKDISKINLPINEEDNEYDWESLLLHFNN